MYVKPCLWATDMCNTTTEHLQHSLLVPWIQRSSWIPTANIHPMCYFVHSTQCCTFNKLKAATSRILHLRITIYRVISHQWYLMANAAVYYRSRIKCLLFVPKTQTPRVTSKSPHTILKKQKIWGTFLFFIFSMVWGQFLTMPHTRLSWILGMKSRHFILLR